MSPIILKNNEIELLSSKLTYMPEGAGRYPGKLIITNQNLYFEAEFGDSFPFSDVTKAVKGGICIPRSEIITVEPIKKFTINRFEIVLTDNSLHTFYNKLMSVSKIVKLLQ